jgi:tetratricopeptide (TPR) repeat protein
MTIDDLSGPTGTITQLQRRLDANRAYARDVDELFLQLSYDLALEPQDSSGELVLCALKTVELAGRWSQRVQQHKRPITQAAEVAFTRLMLLLPAYDAHHPDVVERVAAAWDACGAGARFHFTMVVIRCARKPLLERLRDHMERQHLRAKAASETLPDAPLIMTPGTTVAVNTPRDNALLLARLCAASGDLQRALKLLDEEASTDPRVLETTGAVLLDAGQGDEAMEYLRRALVKSRHGARIRERMLQHYLERGDEAATLEQVLQLLEETGELYYYHLAANWLASTDPARLSWLREQLRDRALPKLVELYMEEGDIDAVAEATNAKTFSHDQLWKLGDFLQDHAPAIASKLYERAILLQGSTAQSKLECASLSERVERVLPFYSAIGKPTKPRRMFRDLLDRSKNNIPMKREFDRLFGAKTA